MTRLLSIDPGKNTGVALGYYDATTPYTLMQRWQVHGGVDGFVAWWEATVPSLEADELVVEKFNLADNDFAAGLQPVEVEGALAVLARRYPKIWQPNTAKSGLIGYSEKAKNGTKAMRQRERFDFLERFGLFAAGTENDDSNDAITHGLVSLKSRGHMPTIKHFWPRRGRNV